MISTKFTFNGITSESMGVSLVRLNTGVFPVAYVSSKDILEDYPTQTRSPYFYKSKYNQYSINMTFSTLTNDMNSAKMKSIATWLFKETYKPFISEDNPNKILYLIATNQSDFMTNGGNEGYFDVQFKSQFPYALTIESTPTYSISGTSTVSIDNECNVYDYYYPEVEITVNSGSSFSIVNTSDSNRTTTFTGLSVGETLYFNNQKKTIISSTGNYRYDNFNKNWLRLIQGVNSLDVTGSITLVFRTQFPVFT